MTTVELMAEAIKNKASELGFFVTVEEASQLAEAAREALAADLRTSSLTCPGVATFSYRY